MLNYSNEGICEFTIDCDRFLLPELIKNSFCTYLWDMGSIRWSHDRGFISFRVPGATRGSIVIGMDNIIKDIIFYDDVCFGNISCYQPEIVSFIHKKYIGKTFNRSEILCKSDVNYATLLVRFRRNFYD